jgi:hypothetical protein
VRCSLKRCADTCVACCASLCFQDCCGYRLQSTCLLTLLADVYECEKQQGLQESLSDCVASTGPRACAAPADSMPEQVCNSAGVVYIYIMREGVLCLLNLVI